MDYGTRYSKYAKYKNVRESYSHLPCQFFWTWLTGKSLCKNSVIQSNRTSLKEWQLWLQLLLSWGIIGLSLWISISIFNNDSLSTFIKLIIYIPCLLLITNRTRALLHTFHYASHGAVLKDMKKAKWYATYFMSIPILHLSWDEYRIIHGIKHHAKKTLCTDQDPDQQFMSAHGFHLGMSHNEFWTKLFLAPLHPIRIWEHIKFRLSHNFILPNRKEKIFRVSFWVFFVLLAYMSGIIIELTLFYLIPLLFITQIASWIQHVSEHLWFSKKIENIPENVYYASLTWGRFLGRPYPHSNKGFLKVTQVFKWWLLIFLVDIPIKLFVFMQDLPSHDFHHRRPGINFWHIMEQRAAYENCLSHFGPMTETWGLLESFYILRDHLCFNQSDPFGIYKDYQIQGVNND